MPAAELTDRVRALCDRGVEQHDIRLELADARYGVASVGGRADHRDAIFTAEDLRQSLAIEAEACCDEDADGQCDGAFKVPPESRGLRSPTETRGANGEGFAQRCNLLSLGGFVGARVAMLPPIEQSRRRLVCLL